jgi:hypothetical protein
MTTLHLGEIDQPYQQPSGRRPSRRAAPATTFEVAEILEAKYHVMQAFYDVNQQQIADDLADGLKNAADALMMGASPTLDPFGSATGKIETAFKQFLDTKVMDRLGIPGVPTKASLLGISHRFKNRRGTPGRPSFVDTGLFLASFRSWVE